MLFLPFMKTLLAEYIRIIYGIYYIRFRIFWREKNEPGIAILL